MSSQLPPRYVNVLVELLYDIDLPASVPTTALRIYALAWRQGYPRTDPVGLKDLLEICGLSRAQLYEHLARLVGTGVLRYTNIDGQFTFHFDWEDQRGPARARPSPENRTGGAVPVVAVSSSREELSAHEKQQHNTHTQAVGGECERGGGPSGKRDSGASEILDALGIMEPTRSELLRMAHVTESYLQTWLGWYESPEGLGTGCVVTRIRHGVAARAWGREWEAAARQRCLA
jgi:hypothetical protein